MESRAKIQNHDKVYHHRREEIIHTTKQRNSHTVLLVQTISVSRWDESILIRHLLSA